MQKDYDVIIVGAGPTGYFAAYELMLKAPTLKVLLIDKGHNIYDRRCPILEKKIVKCPTDRNGYSVVNLVVQSLAVLVEVALILMVNLT